jgi:hypothetical protein
MAVKYPDENGAMIPELRPNEDLIAIRKMFGIPGEYLLSDANQYYTNMNDDIPVEGIKKALPILPIIRNDDDNRGGIINTTPGSNFKFLGDKTTTDLRNLTDAEFFGKIFGEEYSPYKSNEDLEPSLAGLGYDKDAGIMDFIKSGGLTGAVARGIGNLLPDQTMAEAMRNYYGKDNLSSAGTIQSGLMQGYNPVSGGFLNFITGGRKGAATTYGLQRAYQKRLDTIANTLATKKLTEKARKNLIERQRKLAQEKAAELRAIQEARARDDKRRIEDAYATQTGAGSGYSGGEDTRAARTTGNYDDPFDPGYAD